MTASHPLTNNTIGLLKAVVVISLACTQIHKFTKDHCGTVPIGWCLLCICCFLVVLLAHGSHKCANAQMHKCTNRTMRRKRRWRQRSTTVVDTYINQPIAATEEMAEAATAMAAAIATVGNGSGDTTTAVTVTATRHQWQRRW